MTIKIELDQGDVTRLIYELRRSSNIYHSNNEHYASERCLLLACRIENEYQAQLDNYKQ